MTKQIAGMTICAVLLMVSAGLAQNATAPKKFHPGPAPHHTVKDVGERHQHSGTADPISPKTETARRSELDRLEHQNTNHLQAQARQTSAKKNVQTAKVHPEPASKNQAINFSYHPPRTQSTGASGSHK